MQDKYLLVAILYLLMISLIKKGKKGKNGRIKKKFRKLRPKFRHDMLKTDIIDIDVIFR